jgi:hypothetical protein
MEFRFKLPALVALVINSIVIGFAMTGLLSNFSQGNTHSGPQFYWIILGLGFFPMMITIFKSRVRIIKKK